MNLEQILKAIEIIQKLIGIIGANVKLGDVVTWLEVQRNAEELRAEGHEGDTV